MYGRHLSNSLDNPTIHNLFVLPDCPLVSVIVYQDKAEVCRLVRPRVSAGNVTQILFRKLSPFMDKDSVRVQVKGSATIQDVSFSCRPFREDDSGHFHTQNDLRLKLKVERRHYESLLMKKTRLEKQRSVLDSFADTLISPTSLMAHAQAQAQAQTHQQPPTATMPLNISMDKSFMSSPDDLDNRRQEVSTLDRYNPRHMEAMKGFFDLYEDRADRLDENVMNLRDEMEATELTIRQLEQSIKQMELRQDEHANRELTVMVEASESSQLELYVSYVVNNARWSPVYDVRVFNTDATLKLVYYGLVQQATGEDWETPKLQLSTAVPGVGGTVPELSTQTMQFRSTIRNPSSQLVSHLKKSKSTSRGLRSSKSTRVVKTPVSTGSNPSTEATTPSGGTAGDKETGTSGADEHPAMSPTSFYPSPSLRSSLYISPCSAAAILESPMVSTNNTIARMGSASVRASMYGAPSSTWDEYNTYNTVDDSTLTFNGNNRMSRIIDTTVQRELFNDVPTLKRNGENSTPIAGVQYDVFRPPVCIPCDGEPHRVTVAMIDLQPTLEYVTAPKKAPCAFVNAKLLNNSKYLLLPGLVNIYMDNNFVGKSSLGFVAPQEEFACKLGADNGIKVNYNPMFKYKEMSTSSGKNVIYTFKQVIEVKNTLTRSIKLLVMDQLPISGEEKIKISLLEPVIKHMDKYDKSKPVRINRSSIIEWDLELQPGEQKDLTLKYSIEHPANEDVSFVEG